MPQSDVESRRFRLRTRLLVPMIGLVVVAAVSLGVFEQFSAEKQADSLVSQRGSAVLGEIAHWVQDRQRSKEIFAQLLSEQPGLASAVERNDNIGAAQVLIPQKSKLGLGRITVYSSSRTEILYLGSRAHITDMDEIIDNALSGMTGSAVDVSDDGLEIAASAPIKGPLGIVGAIVVGATLSGPDLKELKARDAVELALFREGKLVATTAEDVKLTHALQQVTLSDGNLDQLQSALGPFDMHPTASLIDEDCEIVALVSERDLLEAARVRSFTVFVGALVLLLALLMAGLLLARDVSSSLESVVEAAKDMMRGNYQRRVGDSHIREVSELAGAINHLAQQLEVQVAELARQAFYDTLTELPNRALFSDRLERALARADRRKESVAVIFLDLDNFKVVNDSLGHHVGDRLLSAVAQRFIACVRHEDTVARLGGDEFTVLLEDIASVSEAIHVAERIQEQLQIPFYFDGNELFSSASIGIAYNNQGHVRPDDLLRDADLALYRAKTSGKAHYEVFDPSMNAMVRERLELETDLRRAIEREELKILYQPIVELGTGRIVALEALARWQHHQRGLLMPGQFIPIAEETGLIMPIGRWVLEEACRQAKKWHDRYPNAAPVVMSVNLSARQFQHSSLMEEVVQALRNTQLDPRCLRLEITETIAMENGESSLAILRELKSLGIGLAIDDFGTGFSSLAYLKRLPIDVLKIDRSFVERLGQDLEDTAIVRGIVNLAKTLSLTVTAEGIETPAQLADLKLLGCDRGQGFYFAKPLPDDAIDAFFETAPHWIAQEGAVTA